jgi:hypothetical protein
MAPGAQSGEKPPPKKGLRIPSQETLGQSALSPPAAQELAQRQAAAPAAPGQDCLSTSDTSRPPIAASQESSSREPVSRLRPQCLHLVSRFVRREQE